MIFTFLSTFFVAIVSGRVRKSDPKDYKILGALPIASEPKDINRFSKALQHYEDNFSGTVEWALFHYQDFDLWSDQTWYNQSNIILSVKESQFAYHYFYKYLTTEYIPRLYEYDWIWLMVSDSSFEVFDAQTFVDLLEFWNPGAAQPANTGYTPWEHSRLHIPSDVRVTNVIEIGPLVSIRVSLWEKLRSLMHPSFNSGWGVDRILCATIAKNKNYVLNPFAETDISPRASRVWLSWWAYPKHIGSVVLTARAPYRSCPVRLSSNPACLIVDAAPLQHLDLHEGQRLGVYNADNFDEADWYLEQYPNDYVHDGKAVSYCTSSLPS